VQVTVKLESEVEVVLVQPLELLGIEAG